VSSFTLFLFTVHDTFQEGVFELLASILGIVAQILRLTLFIRRQWKQHKVMQQQHVGMTIPLNLEIPETPTENEEEDEGVNVFIEGEDEEPSTTMKVGNSSSSSAINGATNGSAINTATSIILPAIMTMNMNMTKMERPIFDEMDSHQGHNDDNENGDEENSKF